MMALKLSEMIAAYGTFDHPTALSHRRSVLGTEEEKGMAESKIDDGGLAFPLFEEGPHSSVGMSLRDYFAVHSDQPGIAEIVSMYGLTYSANQVWSDEVTSLGTFDSWWRSIPNEERFRMSARVRYAMADAMIAARKAGA